MIVAFQGDAPECRFVSSKDETSHPKLHLYVHPGNGKGVLSALLALRCPAWPDYFDRTAVTSGERKALRNLLLQVQTPLPLQQIQSWGMLLRRMLQESTCMHAPGCVPGRGTMGPFVSQDCHRTVLMQARWLRGDTQHQSLLKILPLFEAANATDTAKPVFRDLHQCNMAAPDGMPTAALPDIFVSVSSASQRSTLAGLGVEMLSHSLVVR